MNDRWALSYVSDGENARIQAVIDAGVVPMLARILGCDKVPKYPHPPPHPSYVYTMHPMPPAS